MRSERVAKRHSYEKQSAKLHVLRIRNNLHHLKGEADRA